jgi:hypothetical protein
MTKLFPIQVQAVNVQRYISPSILVGSDGSSLITVTHNLGNIPNFVAVHWNRAVWSETDWPLLYDYHILQPSSGSSLGYGWDHASSTTTTTSLYVRRVVALQSIHVKVKCYYIEPKT